MQKDHGGCPAYFQFSCLFLTRHDVSCLHTVWPSCLHTVWPGGRVTPPSASTVITDYCSSLFSTRLAETQTFHPRTWRRRMRTASGRWPLLWRTEQTQQTKRCSHSWGATHTWHRLRSSPPLLHYRELIGHSANSDVYVLPWAFWVQALVQHQNYLMRFKQKS